MSMSHDYWGYVASVLHVEGRYSLARRFAALSDTLDFEHRPMSAAERQMLRNRMDNPGYRAMLFRAATLVAETAAEGLRQVVNALSQWESGLSTREQKLELEPVVTRCDCLRVIARSSVRPHLLEQIYRQ